MERPVRKILNLDTHIIVFTVTDQLTPEENNLVASHDLAIDCQHRRVRAEAYVICLGSGMPFLVLLAAEG